MAVTVACLVEPVQNFLARSFAMVAWPFLCPHATLPPSVNTCHRGLRQGQRDRPDQLKLLRDIISVSLGTSSPAVMCTGVALESHGNREILCVCM